MTINEQRRDVTVFSTVELIEVLERFNRIIGEVRSRTHRTPDEQLHDIKALKRAKAYATDCRRELTARIEKAAEQITA